MKTKSKIKEQSSQHLLWFGVFLAVAGGLILVWSHKYIPGLRIGGVLLSSGLVIFGYVYPLRDIRLLIGVVLGILITWFAFFGF